MATRIDDDRSPESVTVVRGDTAMLVCTVINIGDKSVRRKEGSKEGRKEGRKANYFLINRKILLQSYYIVLEAMHLIVSPQYH